MSNTKTETEANATLTASRGYSRGSYAEAYETRDLSIALAAAEADGHGDLYLAALTVGFFASYEADEVPAHNRDWLLEALDAAADALNGAGIGPDCVAAEEPEGLWACECYRCQVLQLESVVYS